MVPAGSVELASWSISPISNALPFRATSADDTCDASKLWYIQGTKKKYRARV
jgi:hypothetical protein